MELLPVRSAERSLFTVFIYVQYELLIDEKVRAARAGQFDAVAVIPFDGPV
jgi:hypothetical protein